MASAADEVAGLDKVLTRLALTDEDKLERVSTTADVFILQCQIFSCDQVT